MSTIPSIHGHDVIDLILNANPPLSRADLQTQATRLWGPNPRFHTCSAENLTLDDLLAFLLARGKITEQATLLIPDASKICNHDH